MFKKILGFLKKMARGRPRKNIVGKDTEENKIFVQPLKIIYESPINNPINYYCEKCHSLLRFLKFSEYQCSNDKCKHNYSGYPPPK